MMSADPFVPDTLDFQGAAGNDREAAIGSMRHGDVPVAPG
jgi:hypothetical protein